MNDPKEVSDEPQSSGVLVHGLFIEGARWPIGDEVGISWCIMSNDLLPFSFIPTCLRLNKL